MRISDWSSDVCSSDLTRFAPLDILPTLEVWEAMNGQAAMNSYHWLLLAQPAPLPETLVGADGPGYVRHLIDRWAGHRDRPDPPAAAASSEERRGGKECVSSCRSRGWPYS